MTKTIRREILIPQPREQVWQAITDSTTLAEWMYPERLRAARRTPLHVPGAAEPQSEFRRAGRALRGAGVRTAQSARVLVVGRWTRRIRG